MVSRKWLAAAIIATSVPATSVSTSVPAGWHDAPGLARMFTPKHVPDGSYRAYVSPKSLEAAIAQIKQDPALAAGPDAWGIESQSAIDIFGQGGDYNRWSVARLYNGMPARVARGPRIESGQTVEAWTLISPYPDAELRVLEPGTLLIVLRIKCPPIIRGS